MFGKLSYVKSLSSAIGLVDIGHWPIINLRLEFNINDVLLKKETLLWSKNLPLGSKFGSCQRMSESRWHCNISFRNCIIKSVLR